MVQLFIEKNKKKNFWKILEQSFVLLCTKQVFFLLKNNYKHVHLNVYLQTFFLCTLHNKCFFCKTYLQSYVLFYFVMLKEKHLCITLNRSLTSFLKIMWSTCWKLFTEWNLAFLFPLRRLILYKQCKENKLSLGSHRPSCWGRPQNTGYSFSTPLRFRHFFWSWAWMAFSVCLPAEYTPNKSK